MKTRFWILISVLAAILAAGPGTRPALAQFDYIDISNPFLRKVPMAVPVFKSFSGSAREKVMAVKLARMLAGNLEFTSYFTILDRGSYLYDPDRSGITAPDINFGNWTVIGAEMLITGGLKLDGDLLELELRLFDTFKQKLIAGKRYRGPVKGRDGMIRRFCSEVIFALTGKRGFFDSRLAFVSNGTGHKEIYVCRFDGKDVRRMTTYKSITMLPDWSADGRHLAYVSYRNGRPQIFIHRLANGRVRSMTKPGIQITPAWRPGRAELAATLSLSGDQEIYLLTAAGKTIKRLTNSRGIDVDPTWSPDGKKVAFVSKRSGTPQIYIKDIATGRVARLTYHGRYNTQPSWSPNGDLIAYSSMEQGQINIYVSDIEGNNPVRLTSDQGDNEAPTWSPDGSLIAFSSTRRGKSRIFVMTRYGTDQRQLIVLDGEQSDPSWSPNTMQ